MYVKEHSYAQAPLFAEYCAASKRLRNWNQSDQCGQNTLAPFRIFEDRFVSISFLLFQLFNNKCLDSWSFKLLSLQVGDRSTEVVGTANVEIPNNDTPLHLAQTKHPETSGRRVTKETALGRGTRGRRSSRGTATPKRGGARGGARRGKTTRLVVGHSTRMTAREKAPHSASGDNEMVPVSCLWSFMVLLGATGNAIAYTARCEKQSTIACYNVRALSYRCVFCRLFIS